MIRRTVRFGAGFRILAAYPGGVRPNDGMVLPAAAGGCANSNRTLPAAVGTAGARTLLLLTSR